MHNRSVYKVTSKLNESIISKMLITLEAHFNPISRPTLAFLFTNSNLLITAIRTGYNTSILCYHGDGSFVKRGQASSHGRVPVCSL